jgi:hypothetical protein
MSDEGTWKLKELQVVERLAMKQLSRLAHRVLS